MARHLFALTIAVTATLGVDVARAQGFAALVSPPRFELTASAGKSAREVVEISNPSTQSARFAVHTADWNLDSDYGVNFNDALASDSCRPWVAIERREIEIPAGGRYRYRFEVAPPPDAAPGECRFALLIEGGKQEVKTASGLSFPVSGRIGIIVYVALGGAAPNLEVVKTGDAVIDGEKVPLVFIKNTGNAHGRLAGFLSGTDAKGREIEFTPSTFPILPGETRPIRLQPSVGKDERVTIAYPITVSGALEWGDKRVPFEQRFD